MLNGKTFTIQFDPTSRISHFRANGETAGITLHTGESNILLHEMFHAYQAYQETYPTMIESSIETGYIYQCDLEGGRVTLYDKNNKFTYEYWTLKDGSPIPDELDNQLLWGEVTTIADNDWTKKKCSSIVESALSEYKNTIKGSALSVTLIINPEDGKIIEVYFNFAAKGGFGTVPVAVFRKMELEFKKEIYFTITEIGKKLNYCLIGWTETY